MRTASCRRSVPAGLILAAALSLAAPLRGQEMATAAPALSDAEKLWGLSLVWSEASYNFAFFDQVPDLDWDAAYRENIPRVLATESTWEYYGVLKRFVALLQDGHTRAFLADPDRTYESYPWILLENVQGQVVVSDVGRSLAETVPVGSVIETIDGEPAAQRAMRLWLPEISASTDHGRMDGALGKALNGPPAQAVTIGYVTPEGVRHEATLNRDRSTREDEWLLPTRAALPIFEFRWLDEDIAYVALNRFSDRAVVDEFVATLPELSRAKALVVDVRKNGRGSTNFGYDIAAHLTNDTLPTSAWRTREQVSVYKEWGKSRDEYADYARMDAWYDGGTHGPLAPADGIRVIVPTVVLQEHATFSAAEDFLVAVDGIPHVTTVGRPSGGSTGQPLVVQLPGGGRVNICVKRDSYPDGREFVGYGVQPDVVVETTVAEVQAGRDPVLERALEILRSKVEREGADGAS